MADRARRGVIAAEHRSIGQTTSRLPLFLDTHGPGQEHVFGARLESGGTFSRVDPIRVEQDDQADIEDGGHTLILHFHTYDGIDGVDFRVDGGDHLRLRLELHGSPINTGLVYLGGDGAHPGTNPFVLDR